MGSIGRYIFRTTFGAFLVICASVTALMWITQALRDIDLMTNQGQSIFVFIGITGLIIPLLVLIIAPIALMIAVAHVLNKLGNDSELIVMNASGMPPWVLFRPFLAVGIVVSLLVAAISIYVSPWGLRELRRWATEVRADLVSNIVQPGRFTKLEERLTLHIRERRPNGQLLGIFIDDQRDPKERASILAEQGDIVKNERGLFLILENGTVQRHETGQRDPAIVLFNSYGFDLSWLSNNKQSLKYSVRERYLWELFDPTRTDQMFVDAAGSSQGRISRPNHRPTLPAGLRRDDLRLSRRAAHDAAGPHHVAHGRDQCGRSTARSWLRRHDCRRSNPDRAGAPLHRPDRKLRAGILRHLPRGHHRAPGFHCQCDHRDHGTHRSTRQRSHGATVMIAGKLSRYFGWRFLSAVLAVFAGTLVLTAMIDFLELLRRSADIKDVSAFVIAQITIFRVPFITERVMPFAVLVGAMFCYLNLSRRLELAVARAAGVSAWQFISPAIVIAALIGIALTTIYNPISANLRELSTRLEAELSGRDKGFRNSGSGFWVRQRNDDGQAVINAKSSRQQGIELGGVSIFRHDTSGHFLDRIEAKRATLEPGYWRLEEARIYASGVAAVERDVFRLSTTLTPAQVGESFATPETVPFWQLSSYIDTAEKAGLAAAGYRLQYYQLLAQPFYLVAMVLLAASVSLRFFRFGGVQKIVLGGIGAGFLLYVMAKVTGDLSKAGLMGPMTAAGLPPAVGGVTGLIALLYQEDG